MPNKSAVCLIFIVSLFAEINLCFAYIDPGTGGMIIGGSVWPFILGILAVIGGFLLKHFFKPVKKGILIAWEKIKRRN